MRIEFRNISVCSVVVMWLFQRSMLLVGALASLLAYSADGSARKLNIALHAQLSFASSGKVVGSQITCDGFRQAFEARGHNVQMFYPFEYTNLTAHVWDLVFIEGWFEMVHAFVHEMRRVAPKVVVFFFCLDPDFPGLPQVCNLVGLQTYNHFGTEFQVASLDVDGFFTNSLTTQATLSATGARVE